MPKIPVYGVQQEQLRPLPGVRQESIASPGLLDAGATEQLRSGQSLIAAGTEIGKVAEQMQERRNAEKIFGAETALKTDYLAFQQQSLMRRGANAEGVTQDAAKWWEENAKLHADNLENPVQRQLFMMQATKLREGSLNTFSHHEAQQTYVANEEAATSSIVSSINLAAAEAGNAPVMEPRKVDVSQDAPTITTNPDGTPNATTAPVSVTVSKQPFDVESYKKDIVNRTDVLAQLNGWKPEKRDAYLNDKLTQFHSQIIQNRVDKDPEGARAYFEDNKPEIDGSQHDKIEKVLKLGGVRQVAQAFADEVQASGMSEVEAIKAAREKFSGEQEDHAVLEIKTRFHEQDVSRELAQKKAGDTAWDIFAKTKNINAVPAEVMNAMDGKVRLALEAEAQALAAGKNIKTDPSVYYELRKMAVSDPDKFQQLDLRQYFSKLDEGDREKFIDLQHPAKIKEAATLDAQLSNMHDQMGWGASDKDKKGNFDRVVTNAIQEEQRRKGKELTQEERQKVIDRMVIDGEVLSGHWYQNDPNKKLFEVYGTEDAARFAPKVPDDDRKKIEAALKRAGKPVTDAEVTRLYKLKNGLR